MLEWCLAFGVPTEGLKVPEMKAWVSPRFRRGCSRRTERRRLHGARAPLFRRDDDDDDDDDAAPGSKMKAFVVEDQSQPGYDPKYHECTTASRTSGLVDTKLSDVMLAKDASWSGGPRANCGVMVLESLARRDAGRGGGEGLLGGGPTTSM